MKSKPLAEDLKLDLTGTGLGNLLIDTDTEITTVAAPSKPEERESTLAKIASTGL